MIAQAVVDRLDLSGVTDVVDVGGGSGTLLAALLERHPQLRGAVLERPEVAERARALLAARGLCERARVVEGDFFTEVPAADVHIVKLITHDWDDERAAAILRICARALRPGGRVVVVDAVVPEEPASPLLPLLDLHMLVVLGAGSARPPSTRLSWPRRASGSGASWPPGPTRRSSRPRPPELPPVRLSGRGVRAAPTCGPRR